MCKAMQEDEHFDRDLIKKRFLDFEGLVLMPYKCSQNFTSIGCGRNLDSRGITEEEAMYLLSNDIESVFKDLDKHLAIWRSYPIEAQYVFIDLCFNLGIHTLLSFRKTLALCQLGEWEKAAAELLRSRYARQVGRRAIFNSEQLALCQNLSATTTTPND